MELWKWKKDSKTVGRPRTRSAPENWYFLPIRTHEKSPLNISLVPEQSPSIVGSALHCWIPAQEGQMLPSRTPTVKLYFPTQTPASRQAGVHWWLLQTAFCGNLFWKNLPALSIHTGNGWEGSVRWLNTKLRHSRSPLEDSQLCCYTCYAYDSNCEAVLLLCALQVAAFLTPHLCPAEVPSLLAAWQWLRVRIKQRAVT